MRKFLLFVLLTFTSLHVHAIDFFSGTYEEALVKAEKENKLLLLYFTASWCGPCKTMDQKVFPDESITETVSENYIALKLDIDEGNNRELFYRFNPDKKWGIPQFFITNSQEQIFKYRLGGVSRVEFQDFLSYPVNAEPIGQIQLQEIAQKIIAENAKKGKPLFCDAIGRNAKRKWKRGYEFGMNVNHLKAEGDLYSQNSYAPNLSTFFENGKYSRSLRAGLAYKQKGGGRTNDDAKVRLHYVELPVRGTVTLFERGGLYKQPVQLSAEPYIGYAFAGKIVREGESNKVDFGSSSTDWNRLDYGVRPGINFLMGDFQSTVGYDFGLNNLSNQDNEKIYNRGAFLAMSLIFGR